MPLLIKRQADGRLLARHESGAELFLLGRSRRIANRKSFEVRHYMVPSRHIVVFVLKGLSMSMLHNAPDCSDTQFGLSARGRSASQPKPVYHEGKMFMIFPNIIRSNEVFLINHESRVMAGSNTFDTGKLCLGTAIDPLYFSPIDALCFNVANADLVWQGPALEGVWERNPDPEHPRARANHQIFKVTTWPTWQPRNTTLELPPQIIAACADW